MNEQPTISIEQQLQRLFHFRLLAPEQLQAMAQICSIHHYKAGELIFNEGEASVAFYIALSGKIQIYKISKEGKEFILHLFGAGDMFAEVPIFSGIPKYPANALCLNDSTVLRIQGEPFRQLVKIHPDIALNIISVFAKRLHEFSEIIEDLSLRTVDSRVAKYLISLQDNAKENIEMAIHKKTLASILGTIPETLSRAFKKLAQDGLIEVSTNKIKILDLKGLAHVADAEPLT